MSRIEEIPEIETAEMVSKTVPPTKAIVRPPKGYKELLKKYYKGVK